MNAPTRLATRIGPLIGPGAAGIRMSPDEYDAIPPEEWERGYRYEVIQEVLVVTPPAGESQADPNDELGYLLRKFKESHPNGKLLDKTTIERQVRTSTGYRVCDRALWIGVGWPIRVCKDVPTIVVEFVSEGKRAFLRNYEEKRDEYLAIGVKKYWVIDRFRSQMTVYFAPPSKPDHRVIPRSEKVYMTPLLPGFELPFDRLLTLAEEGAELEEELNTHRRIDALRASERESALMGPPVSISQDQ
jgi:Uma2 family endonuclease